MKRLRKLCYTLPFSWEGRRVRPAVYGPGFVPRLGSEFSTAGGADACEAAGFAWCADAQPKAAKSVSGLQLLIRQRRRRNHATGVCTHPLFSQRCAEADDFSSEGSLANLHAAIDVVCADPSQAEKLAKRRAEAKAAERGGCIGCDKEGVVASGGAAALLPPAAPPPPTTPPSAAERLPRDLCRRVLIGLVEKHAATGLCQAAIKPTGDPDRCADCPECAPPMLPWLTRDPPPPPPAPATPCGEKECSPSPPPALLADLADIMGLSG